MVGEGDAVMNTHMTRVAVRGAVAAHLDPTRMRAAER